MSESNDARYDLARLLDVSCVGRSVAIHRGHLVQGSVRGARILDGDFRNWQVYDSEFVGCTFIRCHWRDSDFKNTVFRSCVLIDCSFLNERFGSTEITWVDSVQETEMPETQQAQPSAPEAPKASQPVSQAQPAPPRAGQQSRFLHLE